MDRFLAKAMASLDLRPTNDTPVPVSNTPVPVPVPVPVGLEVSKFVRITYEKATPEMIAINKHTTAKDLVDMLHSRLRFSGWLKEGEKLYVNYMVDGRWVTLSHDGDIRRMLSDPAPLVFGHAKLIR